MQLRPYQQAAVQAVYDFLRNRAGHPLIVLPVGAGKSVVIAQIVKDAVELWNGRILVVTHAAELVEQNAQKIQRLCPGLNVGVFCAGLNRRDTGGVTSASIQSVFRRAEELGPLDLVIVDEAHAIPPDGEGMYQTFLAGAKAVNNSVRLIGTTATPFRTSSGVIYGPDQLFDAVCFEAGIKELIAQGFLSRLMAKAGAARVDTSGLHVRAGEFVAEEVDRLMNQDEVVDVACEEIVALTQSRTACLIFAAGVAHGRHVQRVLEQRHHVECGFLSAETPRKEREETLARFRHDASGGLFPREPLKYLVNYGILTTGFDCPRLDAIALLRPTMSPGLLVQMIGRGTRLHPGKDDCLILDYGGNIVRHGPVDKISVAERSGSLQPGVAPAKECPECRALIAAAYRVCPDCGFEFPPPESAAHDPKAADQGVLSGEVIDREYEVRDVSYSVHTKKDAADDAPQTMRVEYRLGFDYWVSEWICVEHTGWARRKAEQWWRQRSDEPVPETAEEAVAIADDGGLARTDFVTVRSVVGEKYDRILKYELGPKPEPLQLGPDVDLDGVPF